MRIQPSVRSLGTVLHAAALALLLAPAAKAADTGKTWALLIGCAEYQQAPRLPSVRNDVSVLAETLRQYGGLQYHQTLVLWDTVGENAALQENILRAAPDWLKQIPPEDRLVVYFSGHGFRDSENNMYLAPLDVDPARPEATGIPVRWLREQIAGCRASFKLLIVDSCHAGSEQGEDDPASVSAKDLGQGFADLDGVVTLASSTADEKSQIWQEKDQSLFTYWLVQGLKGHADDDSDGAVDIDELYEYVYDNVTRTAKRRFARPQTPVRIVRSRTVDVPQVVRLRPQDFRGTLADMTELLANTLVDRELPRVGVLEFIDNTPGGDLLGADFGLLGKWCSERVEDLLSRKAGDDFRVIERSRLQTALRKQRFQIADLASTTKLASLSRDADPQGMPVLVQGRFLGRRGNIVQLQCRLLETEGDEVVTTVGGTVALTEDDWAMLGRSAGFDPDVPPAVDQEEQVVDMEEEIDRMDEAGQGRHPLQDRNFPFRVRIMVGGRERQGRFEGNNYYVTFRKGEEYRVRIENRTGQVTLMRLLVDGLNTLPQPDYDKGLYTDQIGPRVHLDAARHWVMDPRKASAFTVGGFVTTTGRRGEWLKFTIDDADKSLAARREFTDQLGIITVAFYEAIPVYGQGMGDNPRGGQQTQGTRPGDPERADLTEMKGFNSGRLLGVVHVRYGPE